MPNSDFDTARRSMRTIAIRLCIFLAPFALAWGVLEWWMARVPTSHSVKRENLQRVAGETETLILGSSAAYWDIAPSLLAPHTYNLGNVAQTLYYDDHLLTKLLPELPKLKRVILTVSYVSLFFQLHGSDEAERQFYYFQEWKIPPPRLQERLDPRMWSSVVLRTPGFAAKSLATAVKQAVRGGPLQAAPVEPSIDPDGWSPQLPGDPKELGIAAVEKKLYYHHRLMHVSDEAANQAALEHIITLLRERNIELVLVTPPVSPDYAQRMKPEFWQRTEAVVGELSRRYQVRYISLLQLPQLTPTDFLDADHLNRQGATRFTGILKDELERPATQSSVAWHRP
jgi:hypothetical protein